MSRRVTMSDVAREAGISLMTVSRAVNAKGEISPQTRARVLRVAEEMGYRPSDIARGLATRRTHTLGLVIPDVANPFFSDVARGAEHVAYAAIAPHVARQELIVEAALAGQREPALAALAADPLVRDPATVEPMLDELLAANAAS